MSDENADLPQMYEAAKEEIERLRAFIKKAEFINGHRCPWCGSMRGERHRALGDELFPELRFECAAFTPHGEVR